MMCPECKRAEIRPKSPTCSKVCDRLRQRRAADLRIAARHGSNGVSAELEAIREADQRATELREAEPQQAEQSQQARVAKLGGDALAISRRIQVSLKTRRPERHPNHKPLGVFDPYAEAEDQ